MLYGAGLLAAGIVGSALSLGGAALLGGFDGGTTTVRELSASPAATEMPVNKTSLLSVNDIYRRAAPGVVQITATQIVNGQSTDLFGFPFPTQQQQESLGSGFVIDKAGHIVT